ncbi:CHAD domain-containing protein [Thiomicrorhabdus heinhorstiae]|uniref:CHAD domain-containing protein n=1 Tax=Thiomicrorhabdus heinhorstiae TaxID=2748010 RepID=A0ABS0BWT7_9GAMM|nr:CHAD domain-containing protein [Thiomicrorhabdus heinhorstiae]MBF6058272.1 CHAD domain-containing protein [Thiomicrorhabdus heinhorstiae]
MRNDFSVLKQTYFSDPREIENLHSLRVLLRKILSIEELQQEGNTNLDALKTLIKLSNPLRDLDVFEHQCIAELFEQEEDRLQIINAVERYRQNFLPEFEQALISFPEESVPELAVQKAGTSAEGTAILSEKTVEEKIRPFHKEFAKLVKSILREPHSDAALHKFRLQIKKLRYDFEHCINLQQESDKRDRKLLKRLRRLQTLLGDINDRRQWRKWLKKLQGEVSESVYEEGVRSLKKQSKFLRHALFVKLTKYAKG